MSSGVPSTQQWTESPSPLSDLAASGEISGMAPSLEHLREAVYCSGPSRELTYVNTSCLRLFGYDSLEELGAAPREQLYAHPEDRLRVLSLQSEADGFRAEEIEFRRKDGSCFWGLMSCRTVRDPATREVRFHVGSITDVTDRRRTLEALRASEERFRRLFQDSADAMAIVDPASGTLIDVNRTMMDKLGFQSRDQVIGQRADRLAPAMQSDGRPSGDAAEEFLRRALTEGSVRFEWWVARVDGTPVPVEIALTAIQTGEHPLLLAVSRDISARQQAEAELRQLNQSLEEVVAERTSALQVSNELLRDEVTERQRREKIEHALLRISEAIHLAENLEKLFALIHQAIQELMPARNFYIALHEPLTDLHHFVYHVDERDPVPAPRRLQSGMTAHVFRHGRALLADRDSMVRPMGSRPGQDWSIENGTPAAVWLGVPLVADGQSLGVMAVQDYDNPHAYGREEQRLLTFIGEQTAVAIARKRAAEALRESERVQRALYRISEAIHEVNELEELFPLIHAVVGDLMPANNFFIALAESTTGNLEFPYWVDEVDPPPAPHSEARGLSGQVLTSGRALLVSAEAFAQARLTPTTSNFESLQLQFQPGVGTLPQVWLGAPLSIRGQVLGVMVVQDYRNPQAYREEEKRILTFVAEQTALAIERKRAESDLRRALEREQELGRMKSNFTSLVSHEFRTPLGVIGSSAEILRDYFDRLTLEDRREHLDTIANCAHHMGRMMEEVLLLSRFDAGKAEFQPRSVDLVKVCEKVVAEVSAATGQQCPITWKVATGCPDGAGDERLLRHILTNLLANAVKYSDAGQPVELGVAVDGDEALFEVRDHGIGIPAADQKMIFEAFHRGSNVGHRPGTGLGLVVVRRCVNLHGGRIELCSEVGKGTTMRVHLPMFRKGMETA